MRNRALQMVTAGFAAALVLSGQPGWALAAEEESKSKQQGASAQTQAGAQVTVTTPPPPGGPGFPPSRPPTPEEMQKNMQAVAPMMGQMMTLMLENMAKKLAEPQIAEYYATFMHNYYLALVKQGFSEEQAFKIVTSTGLPSTHQRQ